MGLNLAKPLLLGALLIHRKTHFVAEVVLLEFPIILKSFFTSGVEMIIESSRPQCSLLEAADGQNKAHGLAPYVFVCLESLNTIQKISGVHRAVDASGMVVQATKTCLGKVDSTS